MPWTPDNLSVAGALASFNQAMEAGETVYDKHCQTIPSTTDSESLVFSGFMPAPKEFLDSRQFQGARDFRYNVANKEYELSMLVTRKNWEDDQTGAINMRFAESGEVWRTFKDSQLATLLAGGDVSGNNGWDGATFYNASRTIGDSGTINNILTFVAATTTAGLTTTWTAGEWLQAAGLTREAFYNFKDDRGRPFNSAAINRMRAIVHPNQERGAYEAINQTMISAPGPVTPFAGTSVSNVWGSKVLEGVDVLPYIAAADSDEIYFSALGSVRKPFIYQERTVLEVEVLASGEQIILNNGVMLLCRQRYVMTYGEPRRSIQNTAT